MADAIDITGLTLSAEEMRAFEEFVYEETYNRPELRMLHNVQSGIKMKSQIVFAGLMSMMGLKGDSSCDRKVSGAGSVLSQKYWEPQGIEDTLKHCQIALDGLFKAAFGDIAKYREKYEIEGSDTLVFLMSLVTDAVNSLIWRASWFASTTVAVSGSGTEGLLAAADIPFFNYFDGLFAQIETDVTAGDIKRYTIAENALLTPETQLAITGARAIAILQNVWKNADPRLKQDPNAYFAVTGEIWDAYESYLIEKGENFTIDYTMEGFTILKYKGKKLINMEIVWGLEIAKFGADSDEPTQLARPNRVVLTTPSNVPIGTLNENDMTEIDFFYDKPTRLNYISFGFSLDSKMLEPYRISVAY